MSLSLRKHQLFVLMLLALVTVVMLGLMAFATIAHIDVWHAIMSFHAIPQDSFPHF